MMKTLTRDEILEMRRHQRFRFREPFHAKTRRREVGRGVLFASSRLRVDESMQRESAGDMHRASEWQFVDEVLGKSCREGLVHHRIYHEAAKRDRDRFIDPQSDARVRHFARLHLQMLHAR
jgi:hypothetical protein